MTENIIIVVMGGSAISLIPIIVENSYNLIGYTDDYGDKNTPDLIINKNGAEQRIEVKYLEKNDKLPEIKEKYNCNNAVIGVGGVGNRSSIELKKKLSAMLKEQGFNTPALISKAAHINAHNVEIGEGTFVMPGAIVQSGARIGKNCLLNTGAQVDHECKLGDYVHIAPGAVLCGRVNVDEGAHVGANSVVRESLTINAYAIVGIGAVVVKNLESSSENQKTYIGNPARELKK